MGVYKMQDILKEIEEVAALVQNSEDINSVLDIFHRFIHFHQMLRVNFLSTLLMVD